MVKVGVSLNEQEGMILNEFKILEDLRSKEKAIRQLIIKSPKLIPELRERINTKDKYKKKQK